MKTITAPIKPGTGQTVAGQQIDATRVAVAVEISGVSAAVVAGCDIACSPATKAVDVVNAPGTRVTGLTLIGRATRYVQVTKSDNVTVDLGGIPQGVPTGYVVYAENSDGLTISGVNAIEGSAGETVVRTMGRCDRVTIKDCTLANPLNKRTALRVNHHGVGVAIVNVTVADIFDLGPMGEDDGGQTLPAGPARAAALNVAQIGVVVSNLKLAGGLGLMPGLAATISDSVIAGVVSPQNVRGYPIHKWAGQYPDAAHFEAGDPVRPAPAVAFVRVAFVTPGGSLAGICYPAADGKPSFGPSSWTFSDCTLDGRPIPNTAANQGTPLSKPTVSLAYEDIAEGGTRPITSTPIKASAIGGKPTVRANTAAAAVEFALTVGGTISHTVVATYNGRARLGGDKGYAFAPGSYPLTVTPLGAAHQPVGDPVSVTLVIAPETTAPPAAVTPEKPASPATAPAPKLAGRMRVGYVDGSRHFDKPVHALISALKPASVRSWCNPNGMAAYARDNDVGNAVGMLRETGATPIYCVAQGGGTVAMAGLAPAYFVAMARDLITLYDADARSKGKTVRLEIWNEPDLLDAEGKGVYWQGGINAYVAMLEAVYKAVKPLFGDRVQIIAAGFSWDTTILEAYGDRIAAACDAMAYHGYPKDLSDGQMQRYKDAVHTAHTRGRPLIVSEGCVGMGRALSSAAAGDAAAKVRAAWAAAVPKYLVALEQIGVDEVAYFIAYDAGTANSGAHLIGDDLEPTTFYDAVKGVLA